MDKPVLMLDMDGPLADFDQAVWNLIKSRRYRIDLTGLDDPRRKRFLTDNMPHPQERQFVRQTINTTHWFKGLDATIGASVGVQELEEHFDVWVCTKPLEVNPYCWSDKLEWIKLFFPQLREKLILAPNKARCHGAVLLDDAIKLDWIPQATWRPVVFSDTFNGEGSEWAGLPRWRWGDDVAALVEIAELHAAGVGCAA